MVPALSTTRILQHEAFGRKGREVRLQGHNPNRGHAGRGHPRQGEPSRVPIGLFDRFGKRERSCSASQKSYRRWRSRPYPKGSLEHLGVVDHLREITRLPFVLKGILTREDAQRAAEHGAKGVVVSNHGGRQLDRAPASLDALPEVVEEVGSEVEVYFDGGIRRGSDIVMALALGARAVGLGRLVFWALAAGGEAGVSKLLSLLKTDLATVMALTGRRTLSEIDNSLVDAAR